MNIKNAIDAPCTINNIHESCFKSYRTLLIVQEMLDRKDSHQTIRQLIDAIYEFVPDDQTK